MLPPWSSTSRRAKARSIPGDQVPENDLKRCLGGVEDDAARDRSVDAKARVIANQSRDVGN